MPEPIVFISHFRIRQGKLEELMQRTPRATADLEADKPRTVLFLSYLDQDRSVISFLHAFPDAESLDLHFEGAEQRSGAAYEYMEPLGWEIYGSPSPSALQTMRQAAASAGVSLTIQPEYVAGFLRVVST
jgi:hypothetical protein